MNIHELITALEGLGADFYTGVPDSLLRPFGDYIMQRYGLSDKHIIATNEGAAVGLAAGHYLATAHPAVVYMQNSGIGNAVNPVCSLLHNEVCGIPVIFLIGWRGQPNTQDEPQHVFQGKVTLPLLDCLGIPYAVLSKETDTHELAQITEAFTQCIQHKEPVAFVVQKHALQNDDRFVYERNAAMSREQALETILHSAGKRDVFVCTTGKLSREVYEIRERESTGHERDFLTVGAMGHSLMLAHGIAISSPEKRVCCFDGDGAMLMHLGSLAVVGAHQPVNLTHIVINNGAHETVGGMPVASADIKWHKVAKALGYGYAFRAEDPETLASVWKRAANLKGPVFIEVICNLLSRENLGRPRHTPTQNKEQFMAFLS